MAKVKDMNISILDSIKGIGPKTKEKLFKRFKTIDGILGSEENDLISVIGISKEIAIQIKRLNLKK